MLKSFLYKKICGLVFITGLFVMSGCFALPVEEPVLPPPIIREFTPASHPTAAVNRGNLQRYRNLSVRVVPALEVTLQFELAGVYIEAIYPEIGDIVRAGDVVAELDREGFEQAIYMAERGKAAARINIAHLAESLPLSGLEAAARGGALDEAWYLDERRTQLTELAVHNLTTERLRAEEALRILRAPIDGTVTQVMAFRPGDTSRTDFNVVTIADETRTVFFVDGWESRYLIQGDIHVVMVNREPFEAVVIDPYEWNIGSRGENQAFMMVYGEGVYFPERTFATMQLVLEEVVDVLYVPFSAVHRVYEREFVYIMEDGLRVMRDIETGLEGNYGIEVVRGLSEGEIVVVG